MATKKKNSSSEKQLKATVKGLTAKLKRSEAKTARLKKDEKQLKATVKSLTAKLKRSEAKTARWKKEAERHEAAAAASEARVAKLNKKLTSARRTASQATPIGGVGLVPSDGVSADQAVSTDEPAAPEEVEQAQTTEVSTPEKAVSTSDPTDLPDASWTVARLRAEASSRGLTGLSGKNKAQLIAALT